MLPITNLTMHRENLDTIGLKKQKQKKLYAQYGLRSYKLINRKSVWRFITLNMPQMKTQLDESG